MPSTRTTITLEPDVHRLVRKRMEQRGITFKQAVNDLLRAGYANGDAASRPFELLTHNFGRLLVQETNMNRLADQLEDEHQIEVLLRAEQEVRQAAG